MWDSIRVQNNSYTIRVADTQALSYESAQGTHGKE